MPELSVKQATPDLVDEGMKVEAGSGSDRTGHTLGSASTCPRRLGGGESLVARARIRLTLLERSPTPEPHQTTPTTATRRQDAANQHQQNVTNLGFVAFCPKESRARTPELSVKQPTPDLVDEGVKEEAGSGSDRTGSTLGLSSAEARSGSDWTGSTLGQASADSRFG